MRVSVDFQDERAEFDVPDDRLLASWHGPAGVATGDVPGLVAGAVENPRGYPPLRQAVVPGDQVVIALGADVPEPAGVLGALAGVLGSAGVEAGSIRVLTEPGGLPGLAGALPPGVTASAHDPDDRAGLAYLATTAGGRRVYLNRMLTDADFVLPVGRLAYDPALGYGGPWGVIFPGLADADARRSPGPDPAAALRESAEVSWLLGCQFQIGLVAGVAGLVGAVAGLGETVRDEGARAADAAWGFRAPARADLVIAGVGGPGGPAGVDEVSRGLETAARLVRRGGKIVLLSRAGGPVGTAVRRLAAADEPRAAAEALRGHEADVDYPAAVRLARALDWADVYLLSALDPDDVEALSMIGLERPEEARRLAAVSGSCLVVSQADRARASVEGEAD